MFWFSMCLSFLVSTLVYDIQYNAGNIDYSTDYNIKYFCFFHSERNGFATTTDFLLGMPNLDNEKSGQSRDYSGCYILITKSQDGAGDWPYERILCVVGACTCFIKPSRKTDLIT